MNLSLANQLNTLPATAPTSYRFLENTRPVYHSKSRASRLQDILMTDGEIREKVEILDHYMALQKQHGLNRRNAISFIILSAVPLIGIYSGAMIGTIVKGKTDPLKHV